MSKDDFDLPGREPESIWTVSSLTQSVRGLLESEFRSIHVEGEISNFRRQASGHLYFTLKDEGAQLSAVQFRGDASRLGFSPEDGQQVVLSGDITVYAPRGQYQIRVRSMALKGEGQLQKRFEELKRKLDAEGLFDPALKKNIPVFPKRIGLVTSKTGAAIQDFLNVLGRRCPRLTVCSAHVRVQGGEASYEIAAALRALEKHGEVDVIVLTRGGGSLEDLWPFNEERVARAIDACSVPVISAVGHEIDFTIADFVADLRAPTPSAAAELVSTADEEWQSQLDQSGQILRKEVKNALSKRHLSLEKYQDHYLFHEPSRVIDQYSQRLDDFQSELSRRSEDWISAARTDLNHLAQVLAHYEPTAKLKIFTERMAQYAARLETLSPKSTLKRGYAIVYDQAGKTVRSIKSA